MVLQAQQFRQNSEADALKKAACSSGAFHPSEAEGGGNKSPDTADNFPPLAANPQGPCYVVSAAHRQYHNRWAGPLRHQAEGLSQGAVTPGHHDGIGRALQLAPPMSLFNRLVLHLMAAPPDIGQQFLASWLARAGLWVVEED